MKGLAGVAACVLVLTASSCGTPRFEDRMWQIALADAAGRPVDLALGRMSHGAMLVRFDPPEPRVQVVSLSMDSPTGLLGLPVPPEGSRYELWVPGYLPLRVDEDPGGRTLVLQPGFPVDVAWPEGGVLPEDMDLALQVRWRGAGDHPEALARTRLQCAGTVPSDRQAGLLEGPREVVLDVDQMRDVRLRVPWAGAYRLMWGGARYDIRRTPQSFLLTGESSWSPEDGVGFTVSDPDAPLRIVLPVD